MELVVELVKLSTVGLIAGFFSSAISNRDHRKRKWWELRVAAYQDAIEALSDIIYYYDKHYTAEIEERELPDGLRNELKAYWDTAFPRVRKLADSGAFLFSEKANAALRNCIQFDDEDSYMEILDANLAKARKCLLELVACSKEDLRLRDNWLDRVTW